MRDTQRTESFLLNGGLNLQTSALAIEPRFVTSTMNYESGPRGYARERGYERFDGRPKPSEASYWTLDYQAGSSAVIVGDVLTGLTSGATGVALYAGTVTSGSYGGGDAQGVLILTNVSGTFVDTESIRRSGVTIATANGVSANRGASNDTDDTTYYRNAVTTARSVISAVPGSGSIRGGWVYKNNTYAVRDNVGATAGILYKATSSGWTAQDLGRTLSFTSGGTYVVKEGDVLTGAVSTATATVKRVVLTSGTWAGGDAAGRIILYSQTGSYSAETLNVGANINVATTATDSAVNALPAGGRYDSYVYNFFGAANLERVYVANGVGNAFEWDGAVFVPIITGMSVDTPSHVGAYKNHLFLSFPGGSLQNSATGDPYEWNPVLGAAEIGIGQDITGLLSAVSTSMIIFGRNKVCVLTGDDISNFSLAVLADDAGAIEWTPQLLGNAHYMDDAGLRNMTTTNAFGDFKMGTITQMIDPYLRKKKAAGIYPTASVKIKSKDIYRLFYADGTGFSVYFGRKVPEMMVFDLKKILTSVWSGEDANGNELVFFGDNNGFVYQLEKGTSFDGETLPAYARLAFAHCKSPRLNKRFHKVTLEVDASAKTNLGLTAEFSYADPDQPPSQEQSFLVNGSGGFWNEANWGQFQWSAPTEGSAESYLDGLGRNVSLAVISNSIWEEPHTLHGVTYNFSIRNQLR